MFAFLFLDGFFVLSRNFRRQKVGSIAWVEKHYPYATLEDCLDEVVLWNLSFSREGDFEFLRIVERFRKEIARPLVVGGKVKDFETAQQYIGAGADKLSVNSSFFTTPAFHRDISRIYGRQALCLSLDVFRRDNRFYCRHSNGEFLMGSETLKGNARLDPFGEVLFQDIDRDGTGFGIAEDFSKMAARVSGDSPYVIAGGVGTPVDACEALTTAPAVLTANLLAFMDENLYLARREIEMLHPESL